MSGPPEKDVAAARLKELRDEIRRHDQLYYLEDAPEITDQEYVQRVSRIHEYGHPGR